MKKYMFICIILGVLSVKSYSQRPPWGDTCNPVLIDIGHVIFYKCDDAVLIPTPQPQTVDTSYRRIYFIHGLGGSPSAWTRVAEACWNKNLNTSDFHARRCKTWQNSYFENGSLAAAADKVGQEVRMIATSDVDMNPNRAILIGHSQGAMVGRTMMHLDMVQRPHALPPIGKGYGGFVSVAGPLQGAIILNNHNKITYLAENLCKRLAQGIANQSYFVKIITNLVGLDLSSTTNKFCNIIGKDVLPLFFSKYYNGITHDYKACHYAYEDTIIVSDYIHTLNADTNNINYRNFPKVAFYAVEPQNNIFWRTVGWIANDPNNEVPFQANSDTKFLQETVAPIHNIIITQASNAYTKVLDLEKKCKNWSWFFGLYSGQLSAARDSYNGWDKADKWFDEVNNEWQEIIGAKRFYLHRQPNGVGVYTIEYLENDGVVLTESARNLPYATNQEVRVFPNEFRVARGIHKGSSHMQIRNDAGIQEHLEKLFDGKYGPFFKTIKEE